MSTLPFSACETGQFSAAVRAAAWNAASSIPSTRPVTSSFIAVIPVPGTNVDVAFTFSRSGGLPASARPWERAIEKHDACAAAISSSGLVRPFSSGSDREAQVMSAPLSAPLPVNSILPVPLSRFPLHDTCAVRSAATMPAPAPAKPAPPLLDRLRRAYGSCHHLHSLSTVTGRPLPLEHLGQ